MALLPSRVKFRKSQRGSRKGTASRGNKLDYGEFGLQTLDRGWIKNNQIEACRVAITRFLKRKGRVFIRIFPHKPVTARPPETRMGKGKGAPEFWVAVVLPGHMLFEVSGVNEATAREACRLAANKLGIRTRFVSRNAANA
jgi:large subunit ribosomal protein L16